MRPSPCCIPTHSFHLCIYMGLRHCCETYSVPSSGRPRLSYQQHSLLSSYQAPFSRRYLISSNMFGCGSPSEIPQGGDHFTRKRENVQRYGSRKRRSGGSERGSE